MSGAVAATVLGPFGGPVASKLAYSSEGGGAVPTVRNNNNNLSLYIIFKLGKLKDRFSVHI